MPRHRARRLLFRGNDSSEQSSNEKTVHRVGTSPPQCTAFGQRAALHVHEARVAQMNAGDWLGARALLHVCGEGARGRWVERGFERLRDGMEICGLPDEFARDDETVNVEGDADGKVAGVDEFEQREQKRVGIHFR